MANDFEDNELLFRCVTLFDSMWENESTPSSAAFSPSSKDGGVSVDRQMKRTIKECVDTLSLNHNGIVVAISCNDAEKAGIYIDYSPTKDNLYHTQLYQNSDKEKITRSQRRKIAKSAKIIDKNKL